MQILWRYECDEMSVGCPCNGANVFVQWNMIRCFALLCLAVLTGNCSYCKSRCAPTLRSGCSLYLSMFPSCLSVSLTYDSLPISVGVSVSKCGHIEWVLRSQLICLVERQDHVDICKYLCTFSYWYAHFVFVIHLVIFAGSTERAQLPPHPDSSDVVSQSSSCLYPTNSKTAWSTYMKLQKHATNTNIFEDMYAYRMSASQSVWLQRTVCPGWRPWLN